MANKDNTYVVNGAITKCSMGLRDSKLVLTNDHGIFIRKTPQATVMDCIAGKNVIPFGGCISMINPDTIKQMAGMPPLAVASNPFSSRVNSAFCTKVCYTAPNICAGKCTPIIVSDSWENGKDDTKIDGDKTLIGRGTLTCLYGGIIILEDAGQE